MKESIKHQLYMFKLCMEETPGHFVFHIIMSVGLEIFIFLEHTLWIKYNLRVVERQENFTNLIILTIGVVCALAIHQFLSSIYFYWSSLKIKPILHKKLQEKIFKKAAEVDLSYYDNPEYHNKYVLVTSKSDQCVDTFYDDSYNFIRNIVCILVGSIYLGITEIWSIFIVFICLLIKYIASKKYYLLETNKKLDAVESESKRSYQHRVFYMSDYAKELRLNNKVNKLFFNDFEQCNKKICDINKIYGKKLVLYSFFKDYVSGYFIIYAIFLPCLIYKSYYQNSLNLSSIIVLVSMVRYMSRKGNTLAELISHIQMNSVFIGEIREFLNISSEMQNRQMKIEDSINHLSLQNVNFSYTKEGKKILKNISMDMHKGEKIAIVGYNGAGKSTLIKLLLRLYDPTDGIIQRNGIDIKNYDIQRYRESISMIFQKYKIYSMTLRENVVMDRCKKNIQEDKNIIQALEKVNFVSKNGEISSILEKQLTKEFSNNGINLSGGEEQRIAIARTLFQDNDLIILDEPSSALDPIAENNLNEVLNDLKQNKIIIYIAHRLSTVVDANCIYMMENGMIVEKGTHHELLKRKGKYYEMWNKQRQGYVTI